MELEYNHQSTIQRARRIQKESKHFWREGQKKERDIALEKLNDYLLSMGYSLESLPPAFLGLDYYKPKDILLGLVGLQEFKNFINKSRILEEILDITSSNITGMKVLDLGCGSPSSFGSLIWYGHHEYPLDGKNIYLPFKSEILSRMGAKVTGIDFRPNSSASYEHKIFDFDSKAFYEFILNVKGSYDLIVATHLDQGLRTRRTTESDLAEIISELSRPIQVVATDLPIKEFGFKPIYKSGNYMEAVFLKG